MKTPPPTHGNAAIRDTYQPPRMESPRANAGQSRAIPSRTTPDCIRADVFIVQRASVEVVNFPETVE